MLHRREYKVPVWLKGSSSVLIVSSERKSVIFGLFVLPEIFPSLPEFTDPIINWVTLLEELWEKNVFPCSRAVPPLHGLTAHYFPGVYRKAIPTRQ